MNFEPLQVDLSKPTERDADETLEEARHILNKVDITIDR